MGQKLRVVGFAVGVLSFYICAQSCGDDATSGTNCDPTGPNTCPGNQVCSSDGRCVANGDGSIGPRYEGGLDTGECAFTHLGGTPVTSNVVLIIDESESMSRMFDSTGTRWEVVKRMLMDSSTGIVKVLNDRVRFGLAMYTKTDGMPVCPHLTTVLPPALGNYNAIKTKYDMGAPDNGTPTGESIQGVTSMLGSSLPAGPIIYVLATDGDPDTCANGDSTQGARDLSVQAVQEAYATTIKTYVIAVGRGTVRLDHLQELANVGQGMPRDASPGAMYYETNSATELQNALSQIITGVLSCDLTLEGRINVQTACARGKVLINGNEIPCNESSGWTPVDETHIRLNGTACDDALNQQGTSIDASFPCDVLLI